MARRGIAVLPTLFTLGNLLFGFAAVFMASRPEDTPLPFGWRPLTFAAAFIFLGMLMDGLDGRVARLTRNTSGLGAQLDSMADMVTFGVAPAFIGVQLLRVQAPFFADTDALDRYFDRAAFVIACIYVACAGLRLARFNLENTSDAEEDHTSFKGLPSPGAAGAVGALALLYEHLLRNPYRLAEAVNEALASAVQLIVMAVMLLTALAMVSTFRYVHIMNRYVRDRAAIENLAKAVVVGLLLVVFPQEVLAVLLVAYAVSAPAGWVVKLASGRERKRGEAVAQDRAAAQRESA